MKKKKVLLCCGSLTPGNGGISRVSRLIKSVIEVEAENTTIDARIIVLSDSIANNHHSLPAIICNNSKVKYVFNVYRYALNATHIIYDSPNLASIHHRLFLKRPSLVFCHGIEVWEQAKSRWLSGAYRADTLLVNSNYTKERANRLRGGFDNAKVCWLATESDEVPVNLEPITNRSPSVLTVGRLVKGRDKGHAALIKVWPDIVDCIPSAVLHVVGRGPELEKYRAMVDQSVKEKIIFHGFLSEKDLETLYSKSTVFAMPSRSEGFGLVYIESMRYGIPVVASIHDAAGEVVKDKETGYTVDLDKPEQLTEALINLLKDNHLAQEFGSRGQLRWQHHFSLRAFHERFQPILNKFLEI